jgi:hypothetical protein
MTSIAIRVSSLSTDGLSLTIGYEVVPAVAGALLVGNVGVPFNGDPNGINVGIIGAAKALMASNGNPVNDGDAVLLIGGVMSVSSGTSAPQLAHVVMKGGTVDSAFVGTEAEGAARARADALAEATDGMAQDDARKAAPWIATAPVNPT